MDYLKSILRESTYKKSKCLSLGSNLRSKLLHNDLARCIYFRPKPYRHNIKQNEHHWQGSAQIFITHSTTYYSHAR